jgi:dTDP-4-amino-4,6-dideoxygalactose transaminase
MILNKTSRIKLYLSINTLILSKFSNVDKSQNFLIKKFRNVFKKKYVLLTSMCRVGFLIILEYLKSKDPKKNEIIICSYNLKEMVDIPRILKFNIILIDINIKNGSLDINKVIKSISNKTSAILITNIFSNYNDLNKIKNIAKKKKILLIEDNAIYYGNYKITNNGKKFSGSFGDVSILSFGIMKNISALYGGAIVTDSSEINKFAQKRIKSFNNFPLSVFIKKIFLFILLKFFLSKVVYNLFFFYIIKISHLKNNNFFLKKLYPAEYFFKKKTIPSFYYSKINNWSINMIYFQIKNEKKLNSENLIRKKNNQIYYNFLSKNKNINLLKIEDFNFQNFLEFPIFCKEKKELSEYLFKKGIETRFYYYKNCEEILLKKNYYKNKNSSQLENQLLCLPSHDKIDKKQVIKTCNYIEKFFRN